MRNFSYLLDVDAYNEAYEMTAEISYGDTSHLCLYILWHVNPLLDDATELLGTDR
jgi:hypothetical protein